MPISNNVRYDAIEDEKTCNRGRLTLVRPCQLCPIKSIANRHQPTQNVGGDVG